MYKCIDDVIYVEPKIREPFHSDVFLILHLKDIESETILGVITKHYLQYAQQMLCRCCCMWRSQLLLTWTTQNTRVPIFLALCIYLNSLKIILEQKSSKSS